MNGCGERTGNANLVSIIANLQLKLGFPCLSEEQLAVLAQADSSMLASGAAALDHSTSSAASVSSPF